MPLGLGDEELIERLVAVRGVGRWMVEMLLIFTRGRPDLFPSDDCGVRSGWRAAKKLYEMTKAKEFRVLAELWQPHRTLTAWYRWRAADAAKALGSAIEVRNVSLLMALSKAKEVPHVF